MNLFDVIPEDLFSVLASPNKRLYLQALDVLWDLYQDRVKISHKALWGSLISQLEDQPELLGFEDEEMSLEERANVRGKASFLIRKLKQKGWIEGEHDSNFEVYYSVPDYSSKLLDLFQSLRSKESTRGFSYVYGTYSALKTAQAEGTPSDKLQTISLAYHNTQDLINLLKTVFHNIKRYFKAQLDLEDSNQILAMYYDDFAENVLETHIRPLKVRESVPKYRDYIQNTLLSWVEEETIFVEIVKAGLLESSQLDFEGCATDLKKKVFWIRSQYESLETDLLDEIDLQVRKYTRATTQKIQNLLNRDQNLKGQLVFLLQALGKEEGDTLSAQIAQTFQLSTQNFIDDSSLYQRKTPSKQKITQPFLVEEADFSPQAEAELSDLLFSPYGKLGVAEFMAELFGERDKLYTKDFPFQEDKGYIMSFLSVLYEHDSQCFYKVEELGGYYQESCYSVPQMVFTRKK